MLCYYFEFEGVKIGLIIENGQLTIENFNCLMARLHLFNN